jgi:hypothetical protein
MVPRRNYVTFSPSSQLDSSRYFSRFERGGRIMTHCSPGTQLKRPPAKAGGRFRQRQLPTAREFLRAILGGVTQKIFYQFQFTPKIRF